MQANTSAAAIRAGRGYIIALIIAGVLLCQAAAATVTGINVVNKPDRVTITVNGDTPLRMSPLLSSGGNYIGFQFRGFLMSKGKFVGIRSGRIYNVRYSNFSSNPPATRIVVNTASHLNYSSEWSQDKKQVDITIWKFGAASAASKPAAPANDVVACTPKVAVQSYTASQPAVTKPFVARIPQGSDPGTEAEPALKPAPAVERTAHLAAPAAGRPIAERSDNDVVVAKPAAMPAPVAIATPVSAPAPVETPKPVAVAAPVEAPKPVMMAKVVDTPKPVISAKPIETVKPIDVPKKVSLNFLGADINDVLKALSTQSGQNIVASKDVKGEVTVSLSNVTLEDALDYVAKLSGYGYTKENGTYLVAAKDSLRTMMGGSPEKPSTEVIPIKYTNADDVLALIKAQFPDVQASKVSMRQANKNTKELSGLQLETKIVLAGPADSITGAKQLIGQVETAVQGQAIEEKTSVYHVKYVNVTEMAKTLRSMIPGISVGYAPSQGFDMYAPSAIKIDAKSGAQVEQVKQNTGSNGGGAESAAPSAEGGEQGLNSEAANPNARSLIIAGRASDVDRALELAASLDVKVPQIKIEAKVTSLTDTGEKQLGMSWGWSGMSWDESVKVVSSAPKDSDGKPIEGLKAILSPTQRFFRSPMQINATLEALIKNGNGKLLASPNLLCLEGKPGVFFVGDEVRYIVLIDHTQNGTTVTTETANVGVQLRVVADVSPDGFITMNLHPEVSVLKLTHDQAANIDLPIITRRFTDHTVRVKAGDTIVIGGLIRDEEFDELSKVPILGDLPVLGHLFRHRAKTKDHSEIVIFITASVVD